MNQARNIDDTAEPMGFNHWKCENVDYDIYPQFVNEIHFSFLLQL